MVDDTLCHKRGAKVLLLAASSSMPSSVPANTRSSASGLIRVTLGLVVQLPFCPDRCFCINLLWRVYSKEVKGLPHQTKSQRRDRWSIPLAIWLPERTFHLAALSLPIMGAKLLRDLPANVQAVGPIHPKANLTFSQPAPQEKAKNAERLPTPTEMMENPEFGGTGAGDDLVLALPTTSRSNCRSR